MSEIKILIKKIIFSLIYFSGITFFIREFVQRRKVTILLFHELDYSLTEKCLKFFEKKYNIISLKSFLDSKNNNKSLPPKSLIITFDDGLKNNYELYKIFKKRNIPVTIFLTSGIVGTNKGFWWNHNNSKFSNEELKKIPDNQRIEILLDNNFDENSELNIRESLSLNEINEMNGIIDFQSHSVTHPILTKCDEAKACYEINESKSSLEKLLNKTVYAFAYPNGDYTDREKDYLIKAGYKCAITCDYGYNTHYTDSMNLKRISGGVGLSFYEIVVKSSGFYNYLIK